MAPLTKVAPARGTQPARYRAVLPAARVAWSPRESPAAWYSQEPGSVPKEVAAPVDSQRVPVEPAAAAVVSEDEATSSGLPAGPGECLVSHPQARTPEAAPPRHTRADGSLRLRDPASWLLTRRCNLGALDDRSECWGLGMIGLNGHLDRTPLLAPLDPVDHHRLLQRRFRARRGANRGID